MQTGVLSRALRFELRQASQRVARTLCIGKRRASPGFEALAQALDKSQWWTAKQLSDYQDERLRALLRHAYDNVPHYRRSLDESGVRPADVRSVADLGLLPTLTKEQVRCAVADLRARNIPDSAITWKSTSGTTGQPLRVAIPKSLLYLDNDPYHWRHFEWGGQRRGDRRAVLLATVLPPTVSGRRRLFAYNHLTHKLTLSSYDLKPETIREYAAALQRYRPMVLCAFPSTAERLVTLLRRAGIPRPATLKAVFMQSETFYPWQRAAVEDYFGCPAFDWYAMEERAVCACDCEVHDGHHVVSEFGIVELLPLPGQADGAPAEIVATPLHNYAMPLIRYRTGDLAQPIDEPCKCGRGLPRIRLIGGRSRNFAVLGDGHLVSLPVVDIPKASSRVEQFQFLQERPGALVLNVVPREGFGPGDVEAIRANVAEKFGAGLDLEVRVVEEIARSGRNKTPLLVQRLDLSKYGAEEAR